jgi:hypothetical protein
VNENKRESRGHDGRLATGARILLHKAKKLYWNEDLLKTINEDVVHRWVTKEKVLLPEHAAPIYTAIQEARKHFASEDGPQKQAQKAAFGILGNLFKVPPQTPPEQAFELQRLHSNAEQLLMAQLDQNKSDPVGAAMQIAADHEVRVLHVQKASMDSLDQQLTTQELGMVGHYGIGAKDALFTDTHEIKPDQRKILETLHPMLKGIFKQHDATVARWNQMLGMSQQRNKVESGGKR